MSIDPTALPAPALLAPTATSTTDRDSVRRVLEHLGIRHTTDADGDLMAAWDGLRIHFTLTPQGIGTLYTIHALYDGAHHTADADRIRETLDIWNGQSLWPTAHTHRHPDDSACVMARAHHALPADTTVDHLTAVTVNTLNGALALGQQLAEQSASASGSSV